MKTSKTYEAPKVFTLDNTTLTAMLEPSFSCTAFSGSLSC